MREIHEVAPDGTKWGEYPKNMRKMSQEEIETAMAEMFFTYTPEATEYRQINTTEESATLRIFWMHDGTGYAVKQKVEHARAKCGDWYHIGCDHDYRELSAKEAEENNTTHFGRCYHVYKCDKCGNIMAHDTSD